MVSPTVVPVSAGLAVVMLLSLASPADTQPIGNEMCGDGTTFTVNLPGHTLGIDDTGAPFRVISAPAAPADSVTLPNGCRIYAFLVSGYSNNRHFHDWPFFKLAEFVARSNGYVHFSWWNNLLKPYLEGPLHPVDIVVERRLSGERVTIPPAPSNPDSSTSWGAFLPGFADLPKANPDEDEQFQRDAALVIRAVRQRNPNAIIIVAGHSMGGNAVARLGLNRDLDIDLLAPIDPVGNRDMPRALPGERSYNWTRWRAANEFRGYRQWDCVRDSDGGCRDYDPRLLRWRYECVPAGPFLPTRPVIATRAPFACPRLLPYVDPGRRYVFGSNIRRLYHRWQHEFFWPVDFLTTERFGHPRPLSNSVLGPNYQAPVAPSLLPADNQPDRTCIAGTDPRDPRFECEPTDGHGEIIGHRGPRGQDMPALQLQDYDPFSVPRRRQFLIELATADDSWPHRPLNPDLCLVCDDMVAIAADLLAEVPPTTDSTPPGIVAEAAPGANVHGWNHDDVVVSLTAEDERNGSGIRDIATTLSGAQPGGGTTPGGSATETIVQEGVTTVGYHATDEAGNVSAPETIEVRIDRTAPELTATADPPANVNGWHRGDVRVTFTAFDAMSGLAGEVPPPFLLTEEGAGQEATATIEDRADNFATATAVINLDRTAPTITITSPPDGARFLLRAEATTAYACEDALSGMATCEATTMAGTPVDTGTVGAKSLRVVGTDLADNVGEAVTTYEVRYGFPGFVLAADGPATAGRNFPVKWQLLDARGAPAGDASSVVAVVSWPAACDAGGPTGPAEPASGELRHDSRSGWFSFIWQTASGWTGCRVLAVTLDDGATHPVRVAFGGAGE